MKRFGILSRCLDVSCKVVVIDLASFFLLGIVPGCYSRVFTCVPLGRSYQSRRLDYFWDGRRLLPVLWLFDSWMASELAHTSVRQL
jgi:hypothetical protein